MAAIVTLTTMPVTNRAEAEAFIDALFASGFGYHFDDGAVDCLHGNGLVSRVEAMSIDGQVERCYEAWEASGADMHHDCPIGHALKALEKSGKL